MASSLDNQSCFMCKTKYDRDRNSLCECKHCSKSFCIDCIREHADEICRETDELTDLGNRVKELLYQKRQFIDDEVNKSKADIDQWLEKYIQTLKTEVEILKKQLDVTGQEGQKSLNNSEDDMYQIIPEFKLNTKTQTIPITSIGNQREKLNDLYRCLSAFDVTKQHDLLSTVPKYHMTFTFTRISKPTESADIKAEPDDIPGFQWIQKNMDQELNDEEQNDRDEEFDDIESEDSDFEENYFRN